MVNGIKSITGIFKPPDDVGQCIGGVFGGLRVVHQHNAFVVIVCVAYDVVINFFSRGVAADGIIGADIPVYIMVPLSLIHILPVSMFGLARRS